MRTMERMQSVLHFDDGLQGSIVAGAFDFTFLKFSNEPSGRNSGGFPMVLGMPHFGRPAGLKGISDVTTLRVDVVEVSPSG